MALAPQFDHGGAQGSYNLYAPWGDSLYASLFGTGAVAMGAEPWDFTRYAGATSPEPFPAGGRNASALSAQLTTSAACDECKSQHGALAWLYCYPEPCWLQTPGPKIAPPTLGGIGQQLLPWLIGGGLILVGAVALTR